MAGNLQFGRRIILATDNSLPSYIGGVLTLNGVPVSRPLVAISYPNLIVDGYTHSDPVTGHYQFGKLVAGQRYRIIPISDTYDQNGIRVDVMSPYGVDEFDIEMNPGSGGGGIDGYTLRSGDRLLVIDESGTLVGLPPAP
jgi:hypothetical protein